MFIVKHHLLFFLLRDWIAVISFLKTLLTMPIFKTTWTANRTQTQAQHAAFSDWALVTAIVVSGNEPSVSALEREGHSHARRATSVPGKDKEADESTNEDADKYVAVVIHGQEHKHVRDRKLHRVKARADHLLVQRRHVTPPPHQRQRSLPVPQQRDHRMRRVILHTAVAIVTTRATIAVAFRQAGRTDRCRGEGGALLDQPVIFALQAAEELEEEHEGYDADAGADEHAVGGDVPCRGQEAGVDGVPVPQHL